jgi:phosphoserine phosphatase
MSNDTIPMAFIYDFDGTLAYGEMQEYDLVPKLGVAPEQFWIMSNEIKVSHNVDGILAYMYLIIKMAREKNIPITRSDFAAYSRNIKFFPGVESWFERISEYGRSRGVEVSHYIISSGIKEMIEGTTIAGNFKAIFASSYMYDDKGNPIWPARAVNYTNKTQYIFRLNKGVLDETDDVSVNTYQPRKNRPMPFKNMIYFGDGATDIPCMRLVKNFGGHAIMVYDDNKANSRQTALDYVQKGRISMAASHDYSGGTMLEKGTMLIIDQVAARASFDELCSVEAE